MLLNLFTETKGENKQLYCKQCKLLTAYIKFDSMPIMLQRKKWGKRGKERGLRRKEKIIGEVGSRDHRISPSPNTWTGLDWRR